MYSKARIAGHPIHPMLISFPVAMYVSTVVGLLVYSGTGDPFWYRAAMWTNIAGVVMAGIAAIPGFVDLVTVARQSPRARSTGIRHAAFNVLALALFIISAVILSRNVGRGGELDVAAPLVLGILGVLSTTVAGWLGWTLVQTHHIGVLPGADIGERAAGAEAGERREPRRPEGYAEPLGTTLPH
jgi:uncharacterized membrane protein